MSTAASEEGARTIRVETEALYAALSAAVVGAIVGIVATWGAALEFWGWPSVGAIAAITSVGVAIAGAATAYARSASLPGQEWRKSLKTWRVVVDTINVTIVHAALAGLGSAVVYVVLGLGFVGLDVRPFEGGIVGAGTTGLASYLVYLSASRITTQRLNSLLLAFVALGTLTSMATATEPDWWRKNFSELGTFPTFSGFAFDGTLVAAGLLVTTFAVYIQTDVGALVASGKLPNPKARTVTPTLLAIMGLMFAFVGLVPVSFSPIVHTVAASGMAVMFFGILGSSPALLKGMPRGFFISIGVLAGLFVAATILFAVGFFGITGFEIAVFALIFGWIALFVRFLGVTGERQ